MSQKDMKICIATLSASSNQIGDAYRQVSRCAPELRAAAAEARGSSFPHLVRTHAGENGGERSDPTPAANRHIVGDGGAHSDLAPAFEVNRADMQGLSRPTRRLNVRSGLDGDIVVDGDQIQRPGQVSIVRALKVVAHAGAELPQHECHERRAAVQRTQREKHHVLQPSDTPDPQMHSAPLGVHARASHCSCRCHRP